MDIQAVLTANARAEAHSFLYYLHEENYFHAAAFSQLCGCISSLARTHPQNSTVSAQIVFIYGQVLRHFIYHFDAADLSKITNFPERYDEPLSRLEQSVAEYFGGSGLRPARLP